MMSRKKKTNMKYSTKLDKETKRYETTTKMETKPITESGECRKVGILNYDCGNVNRT